MHLLRTWLARHHALAALFLAAALCLKAAMPTGYMVGAGDKVLTVQICADATGHAAAMQIAIPMKDSGGKDGGEPWQDDCAYGSLAKVSIGAADPALLLLAIAFILLLGFASVRIPAQKRISHARPPLRGPPALA